MCTQDESKQAIPIPDAPPVPGLLFRRFRGECDYPHMLAVIDGSKVADGDERSDTLEDIARRYRHLANSDPFQDMQFVEVDGLVVGYGRVWWEQELNGPLRYGHFAILLPEWRGRGIRRAMLHQNERRLSAVAAEHRAAGQTETPQVFESWASATESHWGALLCREGYQAVRYGFEMVRPHLEDVPDLPLPEGIVVRPVTDGQAYAVWTAGNEAFRDHWGYTEPQDAWFEEWRESPTYHPELWQVAWAGDEVVGAVQNFVDEAQNREYGRLRGWTEGIFVRKPWRRQGVARALIARSLRMLKQMGLAEAALGVDADNPNGALRLYSSLGYQVVKQHTTYRKPVGG